jgi:hypothetical protein
MVYPPCSCCTERAEYLSHHALKLEILHLFAALLLDKSDDTRWGQPSSSPSSTLACSLNLVEALQSVLVEVRAVAQNVFEKLLSGLSGPQSVSIFVSMPDPSFNVSCRILLHLPIFSAFRENFVRFFLRKTLTTPTFKFCRS